MPVETARLLISCRDRKGIVSAVAGFIAQHDGNILEADQHTDPQQGEFFMRVEVELSGFDLNRATFSASWSSLAEKYDMRWHIYWGNELKRMAILVSKESHCLNDLLWRWKTGELCVEIPFVAGNHAELNEHVDGNELTDALGYVIKNELLSYHPKRWMRAYFESGTLLFNEQGKRLLKCSAALDFFYLAPEGRIYPCLTIPSPLGDLRGHAFEEVWESEQAEKVRREVDGCEKCWMICTARTALKRNVPKVLSWIAKEKIKTHLAN